MKEGRRDKHSTTPPEVKERKGEKTTTEEIETGERQKKC
jgi:hypothetical protein